MKLRSIFGFGLAMMMTVALFGQNDMKKADKLLSLKAFDLAIKNYNTIVSMDPTNAKAFAQLADAYRMTNQPLDALKAYEKAFQLSDDLDKSYVLNYAHTLKKIGLYAQASAWYASYSEVDPALADYYINSTEYAKNLLQDKDNYDIISFDGNSDESDFGVSFFNDKVVFSSFRTDLKRDTEKKNESYINRKGNQLYIVPKEGFVSSDKVEFLRPDFKEIYNIGPLSYSRDGRMVAFMRNNFTSSSNYVFSDEADMSIYFAFTDENGDFADAKPFPYNQVEFSYAFPSLGFNGSALYFASNRPGGYGGFDIYVSYFKDAQWSTPENLGPSINTPGNEITPSFDGEELYFASDYRQGLGGYDMFTSSVVDGEWSLAQNMGKGVNSPADDYYLAKDDSDGSFYFTSNRLGGRGKADIYVAYEMQEQPEEMTMEIPPVLDLEALAEERKAESLATAETSIPTTESAHVVPVSSSETVMLFEDEAEFDFEGATRDESMLLDEDAEVYFIQLASLTRSEGVSSEYNVVKSYGNLYRFFKPNAVKIRLGYYGTRTAAEAVLPNVKNAGFYDAFITADVLSVAQFELINTNSYRSTNSFVDDFNIASQYKVKLASYTDPLKFNVDGIKDAGRLEQWTKGQWTIFVLGGFQSLEEAKMAQIKAINRGWADAELVVDENGILRKVSGQ